MMAGDDGPERERQRIADVYARMSDEELRRIALSGDELTQIAQAAFDAETARRHLDVAAPAPPTRAEGEPELTDAVESSPGSEVVELDDTVTLRRFRDLPDALLAKGSLESAGIECYLVDDNMVRMDWFISNALGGVKLVVRPEDLDAAEGILNQPIPESLLSGFPCRYTSKRGSAMPAGMNGKTRKSRQANPSQT